MALLTLVRRGFYQDSVALMRLAGSLVELPGIQRASAVMGTSANKSVLETAGLLTDEAKEAGPNDLVVVIEGTSGEAVEAAEAAARAWLERQVEPVQKKAETPRPRTISQALQTLAEATVAVISTPGPYAGAEALKALKAGLHVFLFSDNVPLEQEIELKRFARRHNLLMMGPDCGTALLGGVGLGFANAVDRGPIGLVGPSGTGIQQVSVLVHRYGSGVSHAIGTGSRDLSREVGAITTLQALDLLAADPETRVVVLVAKPSDEQVIGQILDRLARLGKPAVANFLGWDGSGQAPAGVVVTSTLHEAAVAAVDLARASAGPEHAAGWRRPSPRDEESELQRQAAQLRAKLKPGQRYLRGLFSGGTLCAESLVILRQAGLRCLSNVHLEPHPALENPFESREHTCVDLGADEFTRGRPHPMIDYRTRIERLQQEAEDPSVAVLLLDVVLGYGAHEDPGAVLAPAIQQARARAARDGRELVVIASVCGTEKDPQDLVRQENRLRDAGAVVLASNAQATRLAAMVLQS